jgi:hypothetical protein
MSQGRSENWGGVQQHSVGGRAASPRVNDQSRAAPSGLPTRDDNPHCTHRKDGARCGGFKAKGTDLCYGHLRSKMKG